MLLTLKTALLSLLLGAFVFYRFKDFLQSIIRRRLASPLHDLPGPRSTSWLWGNLKEILRADNSVEHEKWVEEYGPTIRYAGLLGVPQLCTFDTKALSHILSHTDIYQKPGMMRKVMARIVGHGVLTVEGEQHKHQRKILNPAFGPAEIRELTEIFLDKSNHLRDAWMSQIESATDKSGRQKGEIKVDALEWLSRTTLDIIGLAGFGYKFHALEGERNELGKAFSIIFHIQDNITFIRLLLEFLPASAQRLFGGQRAKAIDASRKTMERIGRDLLAKANESLSKETASNRDLLSLLVRANLSEKNGKRLSDEEVLSQIPTFFVAGHETTSTAVAWALFALSQNTEVQEKLRKELSSLPTSNPTADELSSLPYLDRVVREVLRLYSPAPNTEREAMCDDIIPLGGQGYTDRNGVKRNYIRINKGDTVFVPILAINRRKELWGQDANEFMPDRWLNLPELTGEIPGAWGSQMSFLYGPRACIGYRFALMEMKALLFVLIRSFNFKLAVPASDVVARQGITRRPVLLSDPEKNSQLPMIITAVD